MASRKKPRRSAKLRKLTKAIEKQRALLAQLEAERSQVLSDNTSSDEAAKAASKPPKREPEELFDLKELAEKSAEWRDWYREILSSASSALGSMGYDVSFRTFRYADDSISAQIDISLLTPESEVVRSALLDLEEIRDWGKSGLSDWMAIGVEIHSEGDSPRLAGDNEVWNNYQRSKYSGEVFLNARGFADDGLVNKMDLAMGGEGYFRKIMLRMRWFPEAEERPEEIPIKKVRR